MDRDDGFVVRPMKRQELDLALSWSANEGWNPGLHDAGAFYDFDPEGYLVGLFSSVPVGCISAVSYDNAFGFLGLYIFMPEHRGRGFGMELWRHALRRLGGRNVGLDGVVGRQRDYEREGFVLAHRNIRYELAGAKSAVPGNVVDLRKKYSVETVAEYEKRLFPAPRVLFLEKWLNPPQGVGLGYVGKSDKLAGYGIMRKCVRGFKVGPLFADTQRGARELLSGLAGHAA